MRCRGNTTPYIHSILQSVLIRLLTPGAFKQLFFTVQSSSVFFRFASTSFYAALQTQVIRVLTGVHFNSVSLAHDCNTSTERYLFVHLHESDAGKCSFKKCVIECLEVQSFKSRSIGYFRASGLHRNRNMKNSIDAKRIRNT